MQLNTINESFQDEKQKQKELFEESQKHLEAQLQNLQSSFNRLSVQEQSLHTLCDTQQKHIYELESDSRQHDASFQAVLQQTQANVRLIESFQQQFGALSGMQQQTEQWSRSASTELHELKQQQQEITTYITDLRNQLQHSQQNGASLKKSLTDSEDRLSGSAEEISSLKTEIRRLNSGTV